MVSNQPMGRAQAPGVPIPTQGMVSVHYSIFYLSFFHSIVLQAPQGMLNLGGVRAQNNQQQQQQQQQQQGNIGVRSVFGQHNNFQ